MLTDIEFLGIAFCVVMFVFFELTTRGESSYEN